MNSRISRLLVPALGALALATFVASPASAYPRPGHHGYYGHYYGHYGHYGYYGHRYWGPGPVVGGIIGGLAATVLGGPYYYGGPYYGGPYYGGPYYGEPYYPY